MLTDDEIARRRPVWIALSEFYLDTELDDYQLLNINRVFVASGFTQEEVRRIERHEVAPVVGVNLLDVAGEWAGFNEDWLCQQIVLRSEKKSNLPFILRFTQRGMTERYWKRLQKLLGEAAGGTP